MDVVLTVKHVVADFVLQNSWMAIGKDQKTGWALPLLAHCRVHLAVAMALILMIAPRFWFVAWSISSFTSWSIAPRVFARRHSA